MSGPLIFATTSDKDGAPVEMEGAVVDWSV
jgi:hypothetical protein